MLFPVSDLSTIFKKFRKDIIYMLDYDSMGWDEIDSDGIDIEEMSHRIRDFLEVEIKVCRECKENAKGPFD
ncbi:MAG: hypothetical protein GWP10_09145 [Nitrospiraceae bacterium]|nr:hypothetical protein [Nitrospiraceae bacterium]